MLDGILGNLIVRIAADGTRFNRTWDQVETRLTKIGAKAVKVGAVLSGAVTAPLLAMSNSAVRSFAEFDDAMNASMAIVSGATANTRKEMEALALDISSKTVTSASDLAKAYYYLASAGFDAEASMAALSKVNDFAIAGTMGLEDAVSMLADSQASLGLKTGVASVDMLNMERVSNVITKAQVATNASVEQFAKALTNKAAGAMKTFNKDVEEGMAVLMGFAESGKKGLVAGEMFAIMLQDMQAAAMGEKKGVWEEKELELYDKKTGKLKNMADIIGMMEQKFEGLSDKESKALLMSLGFTNASESAILSLMGQSEKIRQWEADLRKANNITQETANALQRSFSAQCRIAANQVQNLAIEIGDALAPRIERINALIARGYAYWTSLTEAQKANVATLISMAAAAGPVLVALGLMATQVSSIISLLGVLGTAINVVRSKVVATLVATLTPAIMGAASAVGAFVVAWAPVIAVVAAVGAAVAGLAYYLLGSEGISAAWVSMQQGAATAFTMAKGFLYNFQENMGKLGRYIMDIMGAVWNNLTTGVATFVANSISNLLVLAGAGVRVGAVLFGAMARLWYEMPSIIYSTIKTVVPWLAETLFSVIKSVASFAYSVIKAVWDVFASLVTGVIRYIWSLVTGVFSGLWGFITGFFDGVVKFLSITWESFWTLDFIGFAKKGIQLIWDKFLAFAQGLGSLIKKVFTFDFTMPESMKTLFADVEAGATSGEEAMNRIKQIGSDMQANLKNPLEGFGLGGVEGPNFNFSMPEAPKVEISGTELKMPELTMDESATKLLGSIAEMGEKVKEETPVEKRKREEKKKNEEKQDTPQVAAKFSAIEAGSVAAYQADVNSKNIAQGIQQKQLVEQQKAKEALVVMVKQGKDTVNYLKNLAGNLLQEAGFTGG